MQRRLIVVAVERAGKTRTAHIEEDPDGRYSLPDRRSSLNTFQNKGGGTKKKVFVNQSLKLSSSGLRRRLGGREATTEIGSRADMYLLDNHWP